MEKPSETRAADVFCFVLFFCSGFLYVCLDEKKHFLHVVAVKMDECALSFKTEVINVSRDILF